MHDSHDKLSSRSHSVVCLGFCDTDLGSDMLNCSSDSVAEIPWLARRRGKWVRIQVVLNKMTQWVKSNERCAIFNFLLKLGHDYRSRGGRASVVDMLTLRYWNGWSSSAPVAALMFDTGNSKGKPRNSVERRCSDEHSVSFNHLSPSRVVPLVLSCFEK